MRPTQPLHNSLIHLAPPALGLPQCTPDTPIPQPNAALRPPPLSTAFPSYGVRLLRWAALDASAFPPTRATAGSAGYDLRCNVDSMVPRGTWKGVYTGLQLTLPEGTYGQLQSRSGQMLRNGVSVEAGVIDRDYRGEIVIILLNHGPADYSVLKGTAVAQMILHRISIPNILQAGVEDTDGTERGSKSFGSTGAHAQGLTEGVRAWEHGCGPLPRVLLERLDPLQALAALTTRTEEVINSAASGAVGSEMEQPEPETGENKGEPEKRTKRRRKSDVEMG